MKAFQTWTPRVRRLLYDALKQDTGCQAIAGNRVFASLPFERICTFGHNLTSAIFTRPDTISYADGPLNTGLLPPWATRWAAWVASAGIRVGKLPLVIPPADTLGAPSGLFASLTPKPAKVSLGFTAQGLLGIAIQRDAGSMRVKWYKDSDGVYGDQIITGVSPVLFGNARLYRSGKTGETDLVLYYLRPALPNTIFARFERDDFSVEYVINTNLPVALVRLIGAEAIGGRMLLYALDSLGRDVTLTSPVYLLQVGPEKERLSLAVERGDYRLSSIPVNFSAADHKSKLSISIAAGSYSDVIVAPDPADLAGDKSNLSITIESGSYE